MKTNNIQIANDYALKALEEAREAFLNSSLTKYLRTLVYGQVKTGKTTSLLTLPRPFLIEMDSLP